MIVHWDADAYFASVEQAADPRLRGRAMAVGGTKRGIIASASYEARRMGVYTPMPTMRAKKICPGLVVVPGDYQRYEQYSKFLFSFAYDYTPLVERGGLDEGYLDLSGNKKYRAAEAASELQRTIADTLKISVSFGVGTNKLISQIASKLNKPSAFREIPSGSERTFLDPLPNRWLPGVGPQVGTTLDSAGLTRIEQIAVTPPDMLALIVGGMAPQLARFARGQDDRPVVADEADDAKSYGEQNTFNEDIVDEIYLKATMRQMADRLMSKVREDRKAIRTVTVCIKYNDFDTCQRSESINEPTDLAGEVYPVADRLLRKAWERRVSLRMVLIRLSSVYDALPSLELPLLDGEVPRATQIRVAAVVDDLRTRFGAGAIMHGHDLWLAQQDGKPLSDSRIRRSQGPTIIKKTAGGTGARVPLNARSYYSFLDGLMSPSDIVAFASAQGCPAVAICDPNLHGAVEFYVQAKQAGIKPIIGAELTVHSGQQRRSFCAYAADASGYANLCRLLSFSRISEEDYANTRAGLLELPAGTPNPQWRYFDRKQAHQHQIVSSIRTLTLLHEKHPKKQIGDFSFQRPALLPNQAKAVESLVDRCNFNFDVDQLRFPRWQPPDGATPSAFLRRIAHEGLRQRYHPPTPQLVAQLDEELSMIAACGYDEYFLTVWDLLGEVRRAGIDWICRGSAADSLTIYCLGISNFCPRRHELYFKRFLNLERMKLQKLPDIDVDFPWDQRDDVVEMIFTKFGKDHAAIVGGFSTYQARSALADVAKVLGIAERDIRRVTEHLPHMGATNIREALEQGIEARGTAFNDEPYTTAIELAAILDGFPRHSKMHPCGVVISRDPIRTLSPTFPAAKNPTWPVTHHNMEACEQIGLVKLDILAQAGLSVLRDSVAALKKKGVEVRNKFEPWDDPEIWDMIGNGEARAVHHIESPAMCSLSRACQTRDIDVLTAVVSVIRPGAANGGRKSSFAARTCGLEPVDYVHPSLEPVLRSTYGVMAYEEHVPQICEAFAGMTAGRADVLRRALAKHQKKVIAAMKVEFDMAAIAIGRTKVEIAAVWHLLMEFEGYSFCRSHSTAYALEAYEAAYLKRYFPAEFLAAVLTHERGFYSPLAYTVEARRLGIGFLAPDVNASTSKFHVEGNAIRVPLWKVKELTEELIGKAATERRRQPFSSLRDFCLRTRATAAEMENLISVGAFDSFGSSRPQQVWQSRQVTHWRGEGEQGVLFGGDSPAVLPRAALTEPTLLDRLEAEMDLLGFPVEAHPLDLYPHAALATPIAELGKHLNEVVTICGMVIADRIFNQSDGNAMKFVTICDRTGIIETELFSAQYRQFGIGTIRYPMIRVKGRPLPLPSGKGHSFEFIRLDPAI